MPRSALVTKLTTAIVAVAAAAFAVNAHADFSAGPPSLTQAGAGCVTTGSSQVCKGDFAAADNLAPGGAAASRRVDLTYQGPQTSSAAGLYLDGFVSRAAASDAVCTAADPASALDFTVTASGRVLYSRTLAGFAAVHHDPASRLPLPGRSGIADHWTPGDSVSVELAIQLDRSAGNSYMGCASNTDFVWFAE